MYTEGRRSRAVYVTQRPIVSDKNWGYIGLTSVGRKRLKCIPLATVQVMITDYRQLNQQGASSAVNVSFAQLWLSFAIQNDVSFFEVVQHHLCPCKSYRPVARDLWQ